jgi:general secretion pathway protein G
MVVTRNGRRGTSRGFTLIELLVVIVILAILAVVVIPRVTGRIEDAKQSSVRTAISNFDTQLEAYKVDTGAYPSPDQGLDALVTNVAQSSKWGGPYLKNGLPNDPWNNKYQYRIPGEHSPDYDVFSMGPDGQAGTSDDIGNWNLQKQ